MIIEPVGLLQCHAGQQLERRRSNIGLPGISHSGLCYFCDQHQFKLNPCVSTSCSAYMWNRELIQIRGCDLAGLFPRYFTIVRGQILCAILAICVGKSLLSG